MPSNVNNMGPLRGVALIFAVFSLVIVETQLPPDYEDADNGNSTFVDPEHLDSEADSFVQNGIEYIFLNKQMSFHISQLICKENYGANLAFVKDLHVANFLAEALSETNLIMDALWLGAKKEGVHSKKWHWIRNGMKEIISDDLVLLFVYNKEVNTSDRLCLTFSRKDHDKPQLRPLTCNARRAAMCERPYSGGEDSNSTHPGWIKLDNRYYKIFNERVDWNTGFGRCFYHDRDSTLAVVTNYEHTQQLGRYLLIGRPSLENAWMDGVYIDGNYRFEQEKIVLSNHSDQTGFPPWMNGAIRKTGGCLLLDRHLGNKTIFLEARCDRFRPYICYKLGQKEENEFTDIIIGQHGYRLHYKKRNWRQAVDYCKIRYATYQASLAEVRENVQLFQLLYVMGENRTAVRHIWLGGRYHDDEKPAVWRWETDNQIIPTGNDSLLSWVKNASYTHDVDKDYVCLKMDRENHIVALNYGSICAAELCFVCLFTDENIRNLQVDERNGPNMINTDI